MFSSDLIRQLLDQFAKLEDADVGREPDWVNYARSSVFPSPKILVAAQKFGVGRTAKYLTLLWDWAVQGNWPASHETETAARGKMVAQYLVKNVEIFTFLNGPMAHPKSLYRGIGNLSKVPMMRSIVKYTNKFPFVSWTTSWDTAINYSYGGVVLLAKTEDVLAAARPFVWPFTDDLVDLHYDQVGNKEVAIMIERPFDAYVVDYGKRSEDSDVEYDNNAVFEDKQGQIGRGGRERVLPKKANGR